MAGLYLTYLFKDKDPVIDELRTIIQDKNIDYEEIEYLSGVRVKTLEAWFEGKTRRPKSSSIEAVGRACGMKRIWVRYNNKENIK